MLVRHRQSIVASALLALGLAAPACADESLVLLPAEIKLSGSEAVQMLLVEQVRDGHFVGELTEDLVFESSNPEVVAVEEGEARPKANGQATITVKAGGRMATATVTVDGLEKPFRWSFRNHV
jgi:hypothetical protein